MYLKDFWCFGSQITQSEYWFLTAHFLDRTYWVCVIVNSSSCHERGNVQLRFALLLPCVVGNVWFYHLNAPWPCTESSVAILLLDVCCRPCFFLNNQLSISYTHTHMHHVNCLLLSSKNREMGLKWCSQCFFMGPRFLHKALCVRWRCIGVFCLDFFGQFIFSRIFFAY